MQDSQLVVYLNQQPIGNLSQDSSQQLSFQYSQPWLADPTAIPLSISWPLQENNFVEQQARRYFSGLLPDKNVRRMIAKQLQLEFQDDYALLAVMAGECAGAVSLSKQIECVPKSSYRLLSQDFLRLLVLTQTLLKEKGELFIIRGLQM